MHTHVQSQEVCHLLNLARQLSAGGSYAHTSDITCKRWGNATSKLIKRIEVRAWSEKEIRHRLSKTGLPKLGRLTWSHNGQHCLIFMYPHEDEPDGWGMAKNFDGLSRRLKEQNIYEQCYDPASNDNFPEDLRCGLQLTEFEDFVKTKLVPKGKPLVWFRVRVITQQ